MCRGILFHLSPTPADLTDEPLLTSLLCVNPQPQKAIPANPRPTPFITASRLIKDPRLSFCSSRSKPPLPPTVTQQKTCCFLHSFLTPSLMDLKDLLQQTSFPQTIQLSQPTNPIGITWEHTSLVGKETGPLKLSYKGGRRNQERKHSPNETKWDIIIQTSNHPNSRCLDDCVKTQSITVRKICLQQSPTE